jgi:SAM-dependent methyltransferase
MIDDAARFSGTVPEFYDKGLGPVLFGRTAEIMAERVAAFSPARVLETAAGTGITTRRLRDSLPAPSHLIATDLNAAMLDVAKAKFSPGESVHFQVEDGTKLSFADRTFDAALCQFGVMFYPNKDAGYREIHRVLESGGRYVFSVWDTLDFNLPARLLSETLTETFPSDPPPFLKTPYGYAAIDPIKASLMDAGFEAIRIDVVRFEAPIADLRLFAEGWAKGSPLTEQIRSRGVDPERFAELLERKFTRRFADKGSAPLQAIFFEGRRA